MVCNSSQQTLDPCTDTDAPTAGQLVTFDNAGPINNGITFTPPDTTLTINTEGVYEAIYVVTASLPQDQSIDFISFKLLQNNLTIPCSINYSSVGFDGITATVVGHTKFNANASDQITLANNTNSMITLNDLTAISVPFGLGNHTANIGIFVTTITSNSIQVLQGSSMSAYKLAAMQVYLV